MKKKTCLLTLLLMSIFIMAQLGPLESAPVDVKIIQESQDQNKIIFAIHLQIKPRVHVYTSTKQFFAIQDVNSKGLGTTKLELPEPEKIQESDGKITEVYSGTKILRIHKLYQGQPKEAWEYSGFFRFQACDDKTCFPPKKIPFAFAGVIPDVLNNTPTLPKPTPAPTEPTPTPPEPTPAPTEPTPPPTPNWQDLLAQFEIVHGAYGYMNQAEFLAFLQEAQDKANAISTPTTSSNTSTQTANTTPDNTANAQDNPWAGKNLWLIIVLILVGGLALNLTPCVLPMIPINIAIIGAGAKAGSKSRGFFLGLTYGLGMALAYGTMGVIVVLTGSQFGSINASPWFNAIVAVIFVALGLAMFDVISIDLSRYGNAKIKQEARGKFITALVMGVLAALLAGACVAPVLISVLVYSHSLYNNGYQAGLLLPFLLGLGMAIPWPLAGASMSLLPKPGEWMNKVKYIFGVFILIMACYYGYQAWELWHGSSNNISNVENYTKEGWHTDLAQGLELAKKEHKLVFVDFWATWCKNCLAMDKTTLKDQNVLQKMEHIVKVKYQAEDTDAPQHQPIINYVKTSLRLPTFGLPTYIILKPKK